MSEKKRFRVSTEHGEAVVNLCTMKEDMTAQVVDMSARALKEELSEQDMAAAIKAGLLAAYPSLMWQVIVGRKFGSFCTSMDGHFIYFYINQMGFCIFAA